VDDAEIVVNIEYTKPGTALSTITSQGADSSAARSLADYMQKLDKSGDAGP
jgi:hypothetical protein